MLCCPRSGCLQFLALLDEMLFLRMDPFLEVMVLLHCVLQSWLLLLGRGIHSVRSLSLPPLLCLWCSSLASQDVLGVGDLFTGWWVRSAWASDVRLELLKMFEQKRTYHDCHHGRRHDTGLSRHVNLGVSQSVRMAW